MLIWSEGRTQSSVADAVGIESTAFGKKLKGRNGWALQEVKDLASELNTTVAYLFGETENPRPEDPNGGKKVGPEGLEPPTLSVKDGGLAPVTEMFPRRVA